ncbi:MAG: aminoacetone oxidase family FAD-binding enzyme [Clostridiales bacterium]|nr:aminoacetone oxidase family FAD-binding enzyme [Clostridiales bacterium]
MKNQVLVIGAGASGLVAAISAARQGVNVTLLEKNDRVGKKLLATGNGRCNVWNVYPAPYHGDNDFVQALFSTYPLSQVESFFRSLGLAFREEEGGRVYPASGHGQSVLDVLRLSLSHHQVRLITESKAVSLIKTANGFHCKTQEGETISADRVVVTGGGKAYAKLGSDGSVYPLLASLGHRLIPPLPALTPLEADMRDIKGLNGIRSKAALSPLSSTLPIKAQEGEILFTNYGVSGIAAMALGEYFHQGGTLSIDFSPAANMDKATLEKELFTRRNLFSSFTLEHFFTGLFHKLLGFAFFKKANIAPLSRLGNSLSDQELAALLQAITSFSLSITGTKGFEHAQVTAGGIDTKDFSPLTMESSLVPGLYSAGEVLNIHGPCGGYNLLFAFTSGFAAGKNAGFTISSPAGQRG